jgi:predicted DNA-binding transcriptional regulator AlpA
VTVPRLLERGSSSADAAPAAERLRVALYAAADALVDLLTDRTSRTSAPAPGPERLLTAQEVAIRTGLSVDFIYRRAKRWPFTRKIGRASRFSEAGLERWLASRRPSGDILSTHSIVSAYYETAYAAGGEVHTGGAPDLGGTRYDHDHHCP